MAYVDASALVKLIVDEAESGALHAALERRSLLSSELTTTELLRAVHRGAPGREREALAWLDRVELAPISSAVLLRAARVPPPNLHSLDAIHLATALRAHPHAGPFVTYDRRLADAAGAVGLDVLTPR